ncbi:MAG: 3-hydroxybutyrate oligomer hydrolase family protein [Pseudolabrys sp.]
MSRLIRFVALFLLLVPFPASAAVTCADLLKAFGSSLADVNCFASPDLTTTNTTNDIKTSTTPPNNSLPGLPAFAFTPITDRDVIAPSPGKRPPVTKVVPGVQLNARIASDPQGQARFLLRLPSSSWNGRLVVAGASGTRSEFNGDFAWSDYVLQKGYAYASQNKGVLNLALSTAADPLACRLNPSTPVFVHFFDNDPGQQFTRWADFVVKAAQLARDGVKAAYGRWPAFTYAVGTSNGGYQVRRAVEIAPKLFDGGVDWEGTFVDEHAPNILTDLPPAILNFPEYASGISTPSPAAMLAGQNIQAAGYPPDILAGAASLWGNYNAQFWEVTQCQWQKRLDPGYDTYGSGTGTYNYVSRLSFSDVGAQLAAFATTGDIQRPLITVAGTMDALLPIDHHARAYARKVKAMAEGNDHDHGNGDDRGRGNWGDKHQPAYRLYEVQNGNHIETYPDTFAQLQLITPHAQRAFDLLVAQVERGATLPPDQCIPRGGAISDPPAQPGHCANLFAP